VRRRPASCAGEGEQLALSAIDKATINPNTLAVLQLRALQDLASAPNSKVVVPYEAAGLVGAAQVLVDARRAQRGRRARRGHQRFGRAEKNGGIPLGDPGRTVGRNEHDQRAARHTRAPRWRRHRGRPVPAGAGFERLAAFAADAEAAGLDTLWLRGAQVARALDPLTLAGALSEVTRTLVLGVVATLPDGRNPSVLARDLTTLDVVSGGRAAVCIEGEPGMLAERRSSSPGSSRVGPRVSPVCTSPSRRPEPARADQPGGPPIMWRCRGRPRCPGRRRGGKGVWRGRRPPGSPT